MKNNEGQLILFLSVAATAQNAGAEDADEEADAENNGHRLIWILTHGLVGGSDAGESLVLRGGDAGAKQFLSVFHHDFQILHKLIEVDVMSVTALGSHNEIMWAAKRLGEIG